MGSWGDDVDYEAQGLKEFNVRFTINFKKIYNDVTEISERTLERTDKHPKDQLMILWGGAMTGIFIFFLPCYQMLSIAMLPILAFYVIALVRIFKCWREFKYSGAQYWLMTVFTVLGSFALTRVLQYLIVKAFFS